jgi:septal ring factor EnvC (AmiA/AmiB activator)
VDREQVQNRLIEITAGMTKEARGQVEDLTWELFHFAQDAATGRDEATAANRAFEELMGERQQQLTNYKLRVEQLEISLANAKGERKVLRKQLMDHGLKIKQLEANLEKAKQEAQAMRDKLDEWCRALNRAEAMAESVKGIGGVQESK